MVLPIIVGIGVTFAALTVRSSLRAWQVYKTLTPLVIAQLNNIPINYTRETLRTDFQRSRVTDAQLRLRFQQYPGGFYGKMTESEALLILNVSPEEIASLDQRKLRQKHRAAMVQNHPDKGGSPYLAMKVNEARDVLARSVILRE